MRYDAFAGRLLEGEKVLWSGRPGQGLLITARDAFLIPFSLLFGGFGAFWEVTAFQSRAPLLFRLWGVPFLIAGLYLIAGRLIVDAWLRANTQYAVTSRRILIARSGSFGKFTALNLDRLPDAQLNEHANGRGTIRFGQPTPYWPYWGYGFAIWTPSLDPTPQFIEIKDAQRIFDQIQHAMRSAA